MDRQGTNDEDSILLPHEAVVDVAPDDMAPSDNRMSLESQRLIQAEEASRDDESYMR